jgi:DNA ligase-1
MKDFVELVEALDATTSANEKTALIADYLRNADPADAAWAAYLLTDQRRKRTVSSGALREAFLRRSGLPEWLLTECYAHVGDTAETVTLLIRAGFLGEDTESADHAALSQWPLHRWMETAIPALGKLDRAEREERVAAWWRRVPADQLFVLNKLLTGGFRLGVSRATVTRAIGEVAGVPTATVAHALAGGFTPSPDFLAGLRSSAEKSPSKPYPFYLASPLPPDLFGQGSLGDWRIEWKWDGIRAQIIHRGDTVSIWSRGEDLVTDQFPEIAEAAARLPDGTVLDVELVVWAEDGPRPFHALQRRLGRKGVSRQMLAELPAVAVVFDCLEAGGGDIRSRPLESRLEALEQAIREAQREAPPEQTSRFRTSAPVAVAGWDELEALRRDSGNDNVEGFVLKRRGSPYGQGRRRGDWWKFKRDPMSLDAVLLYAQSGSGKRANLFTDYTFALRDGESLVPFAKAYSGLSNKEIAELDRWIRRNTVERFGPVRRVEAVRVFEIGFEGIGPSSRHKSGIATRFPRILRARPDKSVEEVDTLEEARKLIR